MRKKSRKTFNIIFFSHPTEGHLRHYWEKAQEHGIGWDRFHTLWFRAYNKFEEWQGREQIRENSLNLAKMLIDKGQDAQTRNVGRTFLNRVSEKAFKGTGVESYAFELEKETK